MIIFGKSDNVITVSDRSLQFGDGHFTTIAVRDRKPEFLDAHLNRLLKATERLGIAFADWHSLSDVIQSESELTNFGVLKVIISRGVGGRGYGTVGAEDSSCIVTRHPYPAHYVAWKKTGVSLNLSQIKLGMQPILGGLKHLNRLEQVLIKQQLQATTFDDAVVCDSAGFVVETSASNLFWKNNNYWFTADLSNSGVDGVMRNQVLTYFSENNIPFQIVRVKPKVLLQAEEMFICNSLMHCVPVISYSHSEEDVSVTYQIGELSALQNWIKHKSINT